MSTSSSPFFPRLNSSGPPPPSNPFIARSPFSRNQQETSGRPGHLTSRGRTSQRESSSGAGARPPLSTTFSRNAFTFGPTAAQSNTGDAPASTNPTALYAANSPFRAGSSVVERDAPERYNPFAAASGPAGTTGGPSSTTRSGRTYQ